MTFDISKTWCRNAGAREDGLDIGAGVIATKPSGHGPFDGFDRYQLEREQRADRWRLRRSFALTLLFAVLVVLLIAFFADKAIGQAAFDAVHFQSAYETTDFLPSMQAR